MCIDLLFKYSFSMAILYTFNTNKNDNKKHLADYVARNNNLCELIPMSDILFVFLFVDSLPRSTMQYSVHAVQHAQRALTANTFFGHVHWLLLGEKSIQYRVSICFCFGQMEFTLKRFNRKRKREITNRPLNVWSWAEHELHSLLSLLYCQMTQKIIFRSAICDWNKWW